MSLVKYIKSKPRNIQFTPPNGQVDEDFRLFVSEYAPRTPESIRTDHLGDSLTPSERELYVKYFTLLYHKVYSVFSEPTYGSANLHMARLLHDGFGYNLQLWGIQQGYRDHKLSDGRVSFNGERMTISSNNGYSVSIVRTREPYNANAWVDPANPDINDTYKITLTKYDQVVERMYCVSLEM